MICVYRNEYTTGSNYYVIMYIPKRYGNSKPTNRGQKERRFRSSSCDKLKFNLKYSQEKTGRCYANYDFISTSK